MYLYERGVTMKLRKFNFLILLFVAFLASCSKKNEFEANSLNVKESIGTNIVPTMEVTNGVVPKITPPIEFEEDNKSENDILYDAFENVDGSFKILSSVQDVLKDLEVNKVLSVTNIKEDDSSNGVISLDFNIETDICILDFFAMKITFPFEGEWNVSVVSDAETDKKYWLAEGMDTYYDLYDYKTGNLISEKEKDPTAENIQKDFEQSSEEIEKEFEDNLNDLADEYNLP
jgi:hypothetical protein